jgi:hypothetical protein
MASNTVPATTVSITSVEHPLRDARYRLWLIKALFPLGDQFYLVALPWLVLQQTGSALAWAHDDGWRYSPLCSC